MCGSLIPGAGAVCECANANEIQSRETTEIERQFGCASLVCGFYVIRIHISLRAASLFSTHTHIEYCCRIAVIHTHTHTDQRQVGARLRVASCVTTLPLFGPQRNVFCVLCAACFVLLRAPSVWAPELYILLETSQLGYH